MTQVGTAALGTIPVWNQRALDDGSFTVVEPKTECGINYLSSFGIFPFNKQIDTAATHPFAKSDASRVGEAAPILIQDRAWDEVYNEAFRNPLDFAASREARMPGTRPCRQQLSALDYENSCKPFISEYTPTANIAPPAKQQLYWTPNVPTSMLAANSNPVTIPGPYLAPNNWPSPANPW